MVEMAPEPDRAPTVGSPCDVAVELPDLRIPEDLKYLKCTLERPDGKTEPLEPKAGPDNTLSVNFVPEQPGKHLINIKKDRRHVKGSPIEVMVKDAKPRKPGQPCAIGLEIPGIRIPDDLPDLKATVTNPSGKEEPAELKAGPNNRTIVVSFMPKEVGKHLLNIKKRGRHVQNSPYEVIVKPEDLPVTKPDASKVKVRGDGMYLFMVFYAFPHDIGWARTRFPLLKIQSTRSPGWIRMNLTARYRGEMSRLRLRDSL